MMCACITHSYVGKIFKGRRWKRKREKEEEWGRDQGGRRERDPGETSAKIESLVLQRVQRGDVSHKHFVGLAETITTQINAPHSLSSKGRFSVCSCVFFPKLSYTTG